MWLCPTGRLRGKPDSADEAKRHPTAWIDTVGHACAADFAAASSKDADADNVDGIDGSLRDELDGEAKAELVQNYTMVAFKGDDGAVRARTALRYRGAPRRNC